MRPIVRTLLGLGLAWLGARLLASLGRFQHLVAASPRRRTGAALSATRRSARPASARPSRRRSTGGLLWPNKPAPSAAWSPSPKSDVPAPDGAPYRHNSGHFYLVHNDDGLLAFWWKCPHLGCTVPYVGPPEVPNAFQCPCHGSRYNLEGC